MNRFRTLYADEIECRISTVSEKGLSLLLYKTARTDADLLDETVGPEYWENDFKLVDGVLYGGIGIDFDKSGKLVWKWDAGTESNTEAEKGRASDAFKRAGFKHGIGRELYSAPFIWIPARLCNIEKTQKGRFVCSDRFLVSSISYDEKQRISRLTISDDKGRCVFPSSKASPAPSSPLPDIPPQTTSAPPPKADTKFRCSDCGRELVPYTDSEGRTVSLRAHAERSINVFGTTLCLGCIKHRQELME